MNLENAGPAVEVRAGHHDAPVKATGAKDRRVENVGPVRGRDDDDTVARLKAVHLDEELVEGLLALVVPTAEAGTTMATDRVDLIDEDDAGRVLLALFEEVADPAGTDADKHLDKVGAGNAEEGNPRFAGDGPGEQRLAGARRPHEQNALGDSPPEALELLGILQESDDLFAVVLRLVDASDIGESHLVLGLIEQTCPGLAEAHRFATGGLNLTHEEEEEPDHHEHRQNRDDDRGKEPAFFLRQVGHRDVVFPKEVRDFRAVRAEGHPSPSRLIGLGVGAEGVLRVRAV